MLVAISLFAHCGSTLKKISHGSPVSDVTVDCTASRDKKFSP
jgi:hypothetical protein